MPKIHEIKNSLVKIVRECGYLIPYVFSDGDGIDQHDQISIQNKWEPLLLQNCEMYFNDEIIMIDDFFFNFPITADDEFSCLSITDGMHLSKRIRYHAVNHIRLALARPFQGGIQITTFYLLDFQNIVKDICPSFVFCNEYLTKMDDDYPHDMFGGKMCTFLLKKVINNQKDRIGKTAYKWLIYCIIGSALDLILNGNDDIPKENHFKFQILGFFLMYKIQQNTINLPNYARLYTPPIMREYLNLFVTIFREYSYDKGEKVLIEKLGSMNLEHFYALIRRYCYFDNHLISIAHSIERIIALRLLSESNEMTWFQDVNRRKIKDYVNKKNYQWDWEIASKIFILADDAFEALMNIDTQDFSYSPFLLDDLSSIIIGKKNVSDSIDIQNSFKSLFSITKKSFQNKGAMAKSRLFKGTKGKNDNSCSFSKYTQNTKKMNLKINRLEETNYFGPAFYMEPGTNLCFFNQALQIILHFKLIFNWINETSVSKLKSPNLKSFFFIAKDYFSYSNEVYIMNLNPSYYSLVNAYSDNMHRQIGDMGDVSDVYNFILDELEKEKIIAGKKFSSVFETSIQRVNYDYDDENENVYRIYTLYLSNIVSINDSNYHETEIKMQDIKPEKNDDNFRKWSQLNLKQIGNQYIPYEQHIIRSLHEALMSYLFPETPQIIRYFQQQEEEIGKIEPISEINQFCLQKIVNFPQYFFIKINHNSAFNQDEFIIEEKITFIEDSQNYIEYELISLTFFSFEHFYSLHRCWNPHDAPTWVFYNDPEEPISFIGFLNDALLQFNLDFKKVVIVVYSKM